MQLPPRDFFWGERICCNLQKFSTTKHGLIKKTFNKVQSIKNVLQNVSELILLNFFTRTIKKIDGKHSSRMINYHCRKNIERNQFDEKFHAMFRFFINQLTRYYLICLRDGSWTVQKMLRLLQKVHDQYLKQTTIILIAHGISWEQDKSWDLSWDDLGLYFLLHLFRLSHLE